jgi:hypothetical protein
MCVRRRCEEGIGREGRMRREGEGEGRKRVIDIWMNGCG